MLVFKEIDQDKKIYEVECDNREEVINAVNYLRFYYPNILFEPTGYRSNKYIIHLHKDWDKFLDIKETKDGQKYKCVNCVDNLCDKETEEPRWRGNFEVDIKRCFGERFWSEVYEDRERHFVNSNGSVLSYTFGEGGFGNRRYSIKLEDGTILKDVGLWHRGKLPKNLENIIQKGVVL